MSTALDLYAAQIHNHQTRISDKNSSKKFRHAIAGLQKLSSEDLRCVDSILDAVQQLQDTRIGQSSVDFEDSNEQSTISDDLRIAVVRNASAAGLKATLLPFQAEGIAWMQGQVLLTTGACRVFVC